MRLLFLEIIIEYTSPSKIVLASTSLDVRILTPLLCIVAVFTIGWGCFPKPKTTLPLITGEGNLPLFALKFFEIKLKGDGNNNKLRLRQKNIRASYSCDFKSQKNEWIIVKLPVEDFRATWRGYTYSNYPDLDLDKVNSLSLHISDKQEGRFNLEIEYIKAVK